MEHSPPQQSPIHQDNNSPTQARQEGSPTTSPQKPYESPSKIDHREIGQYADASLTISSELGAGITLSIVGHEQRGSAFMKYTVYHICGEDRKGTIDVFRRFNEFFKMRAAMTKRFPGCFIPSIPDKTLALKDEELVRKRQRYLNDFVRKISKLPHLYGSEEFQALLRSTEKDLSATFEKWPNPTTADIINKYKENFAELAGKLITTEVRTKIHDFTKLITLTEMQVYKFKLEVKALAEARDKLDRSYPYLFETLLPSFERECLVDCVKGESQLVCCNSSEAKFLQHETIVRNSMGENPYWLIYDLTKHEQRDGKAFLDSCKAIEDFENRKYELEIKMTENNKQISEITMGRKNNSELKYKLEVENEHLKKEKEEVELLTDIIIALVAFIEIDRFKREKSLFYENVLRKLGGYEINQLQNMAEVWKDWNKRTHQLLHQTQ